MDSSSCLYGWCAESVCVCAVPPAGLCQDVQHRLPDPVLSQSAFSLQANVLQTVADPVALLQQGELPARRLPRLLREHLQGTFGFCSPFGSQLKQV